MGRQFTLVLHASKITSNNALIFDDFEALKTLLRSKGYEVSKTTSMVQVESSPRFFKPELLKGG